MQWQPFWLTFKLASLTTLILLFVALPFSYWLSVTRIRCKFFIEALANLPLVLPPSILGFYFLLVLNPRSLSGSFLEWLFGHPLIFSFEGLILVSVAAAFPFMNTPLYAAFEKFPFALKEASYMLGHSFLKTFFKVILPNTKGTLLAASVLTFAHVVGEFGIVLMVGGNIPAQTRVVSLEVYNQVEAGNYATAHAYSLVILTLSYLLLLALYFFNRKRIV